jgi:hypothetical protein
MFIGQGHVYFSLRSDQNALHFGHFGNEGQDNANYKYPVPNGTVVIITNQQSVNYF